MTTLPFLQTLWPSPEGVLAAFAIPGNQSFAAETPEALAALLEPHIQSKNLYIRTTSLRTAPASGKRGSAEDSYAMPGLWADIDIRGNTHKDPKLPPDIQTAISLAGCTDLTPSLIVHSGNGIQAWWLFREPEIVEDFQAAVALSRGWHSVLAEHAALFGYRIDATHDLARIMRIGGSINLKDPDHPKIVTFTDSGLRYNPSDFHEYIKPATAMVSAERRDFQPVSIGPILEGCAWMKHCRDDAAVLPEPEWRSMLTIVSRCREPEEMAHRLSEPYPGYTHRETQNKLANVIKSSTGPVTCEYIRSSLGFGGCDGCQHRDKVKSPISIANTPPDLWEGVETIDPDMELLPTSQDFFEAQEIPKPWKEMLKLKDSKKGYLGNEYNASVVLSCNPTFARALAYNELTRAIEILRPIGKIESNIPAEWQDRHSIAFTVWLQYHDIPAQKKISDNAAIYIATRNSYHPVKDYLRSLHWDGKPRISSWLTTYLGVEDSAYARAVGAKWLISGIARIMRPGCKADHMLILEGPQGIGKSTAIEILSRGFYTDTLGDCTSKDSAISVQRVWIVEVGELSSFKKTSEVEHIKAFVSRSTDRIRLPYATGIQDMPRQCIFAGTTNQEQYLVDETGNRRFWPVSCTQINLETLAADRDQLWAEALIAYEDGKSWWLEDSALIDEAKKQQESRLEVEVWESVIVEYLNRLASSAKTTVTTEEILTKGLLIPVPQLEHRHKMRVGKIMSKLGVEKKKIRDGKSFFYGFTVPSRLEARTS